MSSFEGQTESCCYYHASLIVLRNYVIASEFCSNLTSSPPQKAYSSQPQPYTGYIPSDMTTSRGDYMHNLASTALLSAASTVTFSQDHSPAAIATAQSALSDFVTSMDWNHRQRSEYSPEGTISRDTMANGRVENDRESMYHLSTPANHENRVNSGGVQKPRAEASTRSFILSPANSRRESSSGASSQHDGGENGEDHHNLGNSSIEQQRRRRFLERNRVAASKCRQKKKVWIQDLERRAEEATMQNRSLHIAVAQLKEEVLILKNQLLAHRNCGCSAVQQFLNSDVSCSVNPTQAAVTAAGVFPLTTQGMHSPSQQHHRMTHPSTAPSMLFQGPPPQSLLYHQPQSNPYHHHTSSVDMSAVPNGIVVTSNAANSFVGSMDGIN
ncbi:hypothetical protein GGH94_005178 [Coemansia aciculifera]|uniref:BZIP domain-containing protein n=1 Tax=Coemansia aciculifera TaxID=417176 RepID=A0A9W8M1I9_9FUNG|nr:hypothetical protein GGH94_005178 [Coemansia aciculifera]KAJ2871086.1 hypothetical protein GGH93_005083 [Coemansia aciculifera]